MLRDVGRSRMELSYGPLLYSSHHARPPLRELHQSEEAGRNVVDRVAFPAILQGRFMEHLLQFAVEPAVGSCRLRQVVGDVRTIARHVEQGFVDVAAVADEVRRQFT